MSRTSVLQRGALAAAVIAAAAVSACSSGLLSDPQRPVASAKMVATQGNSVAGLVTFRRSGDQLSARVQLTGLPANSEHGFHIHEKADCTAPDGSSAGGHFNPSAMPHGPQGGARHAGDMPNLRADAQGCVDTTLMVSGVSAGGGAANDIVGRSLIVHAAPDDYRTQPTGNSGARLACGLIIDR